MKDINSTPSCNVIYHHDEYVVTLGKELQIFRLDGSFVARGENIRWPYKIAFLPENKLIVGGSEDGQYHYISLVDGRDIWHFPAEHKSQVPIRKFAVSPDGKVIYDAYRDLKNKPHIVRICPEEKSSIFSEVSKGLRVTNHIFCDKDGVLCALESHLHKEGIEKIGIREMKPISEQRNTLWRNQWTQDAKLRPLFTDGCYVLHRDFTVLNIETKEMFTLFENKGDWNPIGGMANCTYDSERGILVSSDLDVHENVVIDCRKRRMIARYSGYSHGEKYIGCLVGDEFWIGTPKGVVRKPFPVIEKMPQYRQIYC